MKSIQIISAVLLFLSAEFCMAQDDSFGMVQGRVYDAANHRTVSNVTVILSQDDIPKDTLSSNTFGVFLFDSLQAGSYSLSILASGFHKKQFAEVKIEGGKASLMNVPVISVSTDMSNVTYGRHFDNCTPSRGTILDTSVLVAVLDIAVQTSSSSNQSSGCIAVGYGTRISSMYYVDGIPVRGQTNLPSAEVEQVTVITGGIPVRYSDDPEKNKSGESRSDKAYSDDVEIRTLTLRH